MKEKKKTLFVLVLLVLVGITSGYIANTYAKYASEITGNEGTATVAKWNFTDDNKKQTLTINLDETPDPKTLVGGKIAPGTSGSFKIALKNTSDTGVDYTIKLNGINNIPTNLKFYADAAHSTVLTPGEGKITDHLDAKTDATPTQSKFATIYWAWNFENVEAAAGANYNPVTDGTNVQDTTDGTNPEELTISVDIIGVQTEPAPASGPSETN